MSATAIDTTTVDFHFDVLCPYAYQTAKWIRSVREQNGITINWRFFSLEEVNRIEGKKHPWERPWSYGWSIMRIGALIRRSSMDDLDRWYERSGRALHEDGHKPHEPDVARHLLEDIGLDPAIVDQAISDPTTHDDVKADHDKVIAHAGFGVPTLFFPPVDPTVEVDEGSTRPSSGEACLFGPVLVNPPEGEAALRLWDSVIAWTEFPELYELQKPKMKADEQAIAGTFRPYLEARDWISINRGTEVGFSDDGFEKVGSAKESSDRRAAAREQGDAT